jgi:hypothetical protein
MITTPEGSTITVCSAVCALSWLVYGLPVGAAELQKTSGPAEQRRTPDQEAA